MMHHSSYIQQQQQKLSNEKQKHRQKRFKRRVLYIDKQEYTDFPGADH